MSRDPDFDTPHFCVGWLLSSLTHVRNDIRRAKVLVEYARTKADRKAANARLDEICASIMRTLEELDPNRRHHTPEAAQGGAEDLPIKRVRRGEGARA